MKKFNVITFDINSRKMVPYDVIEPLVRIYKKLTPKKRPKSEKEFKEFIKSECMYYWWSKCEWEIIICGWPFQDVQEKWDVYKQIMMNFDLIIDTLKEELKLKF